MDQCPKGMPPAAKKLRVPDQEQFLRVEEYPNLCDGEAYFGPSDTEGIFVIWADFFMSLWVDPTQRRRTRPFSFPAKYALSSSKNDFMAISGDQRRTLQASFSLLIAALAPSDRGFRSHSTRSIVVFGKLTGIQVGMEAIAQLVCVVELAEIFVS